MKLVLHLLYLCCFASLHQACNHLDRDALLSLNFNLSSPPWNWSSSVDCCFLEGIKCDASGRVSHLLLPFRGFRGSIPPSIGNLTHLSHLNLSHNLFSGSLPIGSLLSLTLLETLDLSYNSLSGEFPSFLSPIYIEILDLSSNQLQGKIPSTFFHQTQHLISFNVSNNSFTGIIPSSAWIDSFCSIKLLDFSYNEFIGQIPLGLGNCSRLKTFRAGFNHLSGSLPDDIHAATSVEELSLPFNNFSGSIRNGVVNLTSLRILELYSNRFTGSIPQDIGKLTNLKTLLLYSNYLSGSLPPSMKNCTNLKTLSLWHNFFEGDVSTFNFSTLLKLHTLDLGSNNFTGGFPLSLVSCKSLTAVSLSNNQLEGQISPDIVALESLTFLALSFNFFTNITGAIRSLMGCKNLKILIIPRNFMYEALPNDDLITVANGFQNLQVLALGKCKFKGQVPSWLGKLKKLQVLDLSLNQLTGSVPGWIGNMPSLFYIDLSDNLISGKFPKELCRLPALASKQMKNDVNGSHLEFPLYVRRNNATLVYSKLFNFPPSIYMKNNNLSGNIPVEIGQLKLLHVLDLSHNNFSGKIPNQISQLTNLERMDLSKNHLCGEIPASFGGLHFLSSFSVANNNLQGPIPSGGQFDTFPSSSFEGNPGLCGDIVKRSCSIQPRTTSTNPGVPRKSLENEELHYGLVAGAVFGFIIGAVSGILYPLQRLKFLQHLIRFRRHRSGRQNKRHRINHVIQLGKTR